ncbi:MAG: long-chain-fatty-acid--CoA ligase [Cytophagales bacterium]|nr:MAG: long-chain-fatty-acid--CoA ligase [Cytophagales bacterium]
MTDTRISYGKSSHEINPEFKKNLAELIDESVVKYKDLPAYTNMDVTMSFAELDEYSKQFAAFLQHEAKLKPGDRIAIQMPNLLQYPVALFGAIRAGLIVVNTNPLYTPREMEHQFKDAGCKCIVILANFASQLEKIISKTSIETVVITEIGDLMPFLKRNIVNFVVKHVKKMVPSHGLTQAISFRDALQRGKGKTYAPTKAQPNETAFIQYTGGTTGVSKGAELTHRNILSNVMQILDFMNRGNKTLVHGKEIIVTALPLYHIFSLTVNCFAFSYYGAQNILITNPKDIPGFIKDLKKYSFSAFTGVNTLFSALMNDPKFKEISFSNLSVTVGGAMAVQAAVAMRWRELTGCAIAEGYGLTETSPVASCNPIDGSGILSTIGIPVASTEIRIVDDNGQDIPQGEVGEILVRGPQVMKGYYNHPAETAKVLLPDGWLKTGDLAIMLSSGYFKIADRKKDMILISGFNVYPNELEDVICSHPKVREAAAIGIPDEKSGEAIKVFVVKRDESLTSEELRAYCKENLTSYKVPKLFEFRTELPKTNVGKVLRRDLREEELKKIKA